MTFSNRFAMTTRQSQRLTVLGFTIGYLALMLLLVSLTSPNFDGYRYIIAPTLGGLALVGAALLAAARTARTRSD